MTSNQLTSRGIQTLASQHGWREVGNRWQYPIFDLEGNRIATRSKAMTKDTAKYLWVESNGVYKPDNPLADWYILPNTLEAITKANGVVYIANGEASALAHHTAQVYNTIATTLSEVSVPDNILTLFQEIGISRVVLLADNDDAGERAAINWRDTLAGSGIDYEALSWGDDKKDGYDSNDAWIEVNFNADAFKTLLGSLKPLSLPVYEPKQDITYDETDFTETPQGLIDLLASVLHVQSWRQSGWSKNVSSPFHEDKKPSFGIRKDTGVGKDFATGESYSPTQIADRLGIDWRRFYPQQEGVNRNDTKPIDPAKLRENNRRILAQLERQKTVECYDSPALPGGYQSWIDQRYIPESWIKALLGLAVSNSAVVPVFLTLHDAFRTGKINPQCFSRKDVDTLIGSRRKSTTAALETLETWGFVSFLHTNSNNSNSDENDTKLSDGGRPTQYCHRIASTDAGLNAALLSDMMERKVVETIGKRTLSPRTLTIAYELGLSRDEALVWQQRCEGAVDSRAKYLIEMLNKKWHDQLWDYSPLEIELDDFQSAKDIRVKLLRGFLADKPNGVQISNAELAMMLGCSESNLSSVYDSAWVLTEQRREWVTISDNLKNLNLDAELKKAQHEHQGRALAIKIQYPDEGHEKGFGYTPPLYGESAMFSGVASHRHTMTKLYIWVEQPSLIYLAKAIQGFYIAYLYQFAIIAYAIQELQKMIDLGMDEAQETEATTDNEPIEDDGAEIEADDTPELVVNKPRTPSQSGKVDRDWTHHDRAWVRHQLDLEAHMFTQDAFLPDNLSNKQAVKWLADHAKQTAIRSIESFYDRDEGDSTLIDLARFLGGEKVEGLKAVQPKPLPKPEPLPFDGGDNPYLESTPASANKTAEYAKPSDKAIEIMVKSFNRDTKPHVNRFAGIANKGA